MAKETTNGTIYSVSSLKTRVYDVICIGSGWAARPIAERTVKAGMTALIIDNDLMGGDCPFWACVPSKALLRPSEALEAAKAVGGARERVSDQSVDVEAVFARRTAFTKDWDDAKLLVPAILDTGTDLLRGKAKLVGEKKVEVKLGEEEAITVTARQAVAVCTGSVPVIPDVPGLREIKPWTPREATSSNKLPAHLVVLGAGAVGIEMATAYNSFGAQVTVINSGSEILSKLDPKAGQKVREGLSARGVRFLLGTKLRKVDRLADSRLSLRTSGGEDLTASEILVAAGRKARTDDCGLEQFGLPVNGTPIQVDESLRVTSVPGDWLFAVGDVNGRSLLTHMCKYQGRIAANTIIQQAKGKDISPQVAWAPTSATADKKTIPQVIFSQPAVAAVGLTRADAEANGIAVRVVEVPAVNVGTLLHSDDFGTGWAQWVIDAHTEQLLGMTVVGQDVTELIHAATVAIVGGLRVSQLAHAVPCFPTMSEVYLNLAEAADL